MSIAEKLTQIAENQKAVYDAGKQAEHDRFWDAFQENGTRTIYEHAFYRWYTPDIFKPKYDLKPTDCKQMFARFGNYTTSLTALLEQAGVTLDTSNATTHSNMFYASRLMEIPNIDVTNSTRIDSLFYDCLWLKKVELTIAANTVPDYTGVFSSCGALEELTVNGVLDKSLSLSWSSLLTTASVQSVIDALKDLTGATAQTLTFHADVGAKLTDAQKAAVTAKNWTLVY